MSNEQIKKSEDQPQALSEEELQSQQAEELPDRELGEGMADWGSVDAFGCVVSGPAWQRGGLPDVAVHRWAALATYPEV